MARFGVRARITAVATVVVLLVLVVTGVVLVAQQRRVLTETLDESLEQQAAEIRQTPALRDADPREIPPFGEDDAVAQVLSDGEVVASTANVEGEGPLLDPLDVTGSGIRTVDRMPHEDAPFRVLVDATGGRAIIVGGTLDDIDESLTTLRLSLLAMFPVVVLALAGLLWWVVGRALRPVEAIRAEVAGIGGRDLHRRVPVPASDDEVGRLARTMNDMLERVEDATRRQRRFLADASHELRSPLTRMRTELEVDLSHPDRADPLATHASVLEETIGLQRLADDLLLVARVDEGGASGVRELVDLDDVVLRVARRLRADDRVRVDLSGVGAARVVGDPDQLTRLIGNLADNAVRHATSRVAFSLTRHGDGVVLSVADDGPGVPDADRERIFERFSRVDGARRAADGGTGLGLAIARDIAIAHGGTLVLESSRGATFALRLPAARAD
jgi:signal transduction histidine kinase